MRPRQDTIPAPIGAAGDTIIFLDFDGVLNSLHAWSTTCWRGPSSSSERIDPAMVARVAKLVMALNAKVVVSSAWRIYFDLPYLQSILEQFGFPADAIIDRTLSLPTDDPNSERGEEIKEWLDRHPQVKRFVILDDSGDMDPVRAHWVQTMWDDGIQDEHVDRVLSGVEKGLFNRQAQNTE
jgi:hypothetical protein